MTAVRSFAKRLEHAVRCEDVFAAWSAYRLLAVDHRQLRATLSPELHRETLHLVKTMARRQSYSIAATPPYVVAKRMQYVVDTMQALDVPMRSADYQTLIDMYSRLPDLSRMETTFEKYLEYRQGSLTNGPTIEVCNSMLMGYTNSYNVESALSWLDIMTGKYELKPNAFTYYALMKLFSRLEDVESTERIFKMIMSNSQLPKLVDEQEIVSRYAPLSLDEQLELLLQQAKALHDDTADILSRSNTKTESPYTLNDVQPAVDQSSDILDASKSAFAAKLQTTRPPATARDIKMTIQQEEKVLGQQKKQKSYNTKSAMLPDQHAYTYIIRVHARHRHMLQCIVYTSMYLTQAKTLPVGSWDSVSLRSPANLCMMFNALLFALCRNDNSPVVPTLFSAMWSGELGFKVDNMSWNLLLQYYLRSGDVARAKELESIMKQNAVNFARALNSKTLQVSADVPSTYSRVPTNVYPLTKNNIPVTRDQPNSNLPTKLQPGTKALHRWALDNLPMVSPSLWQPTPFKKDSLLSQLLTNTPPLSSISTEQQSTSSLSKPIELNLASTEKQNTSHISSDVEIGLNAPILSYLSYQALRNSSFHMNRSPNTVKQLPRDVRTWLLRHASDHKVWRRNKIEK